MGSLRVGHGWVASFSLFTFMLRKRKWQPTPVFLPGESQRWESLVGYHLWGHTVGHHWSDLATILYWFRHTSTRVHHGCTCVHHPEPPSHLPPRTIPLGCPSAPAPSIQYHALNLDWRLVSYMILYMFQCHSLKSSHPLPLPLSPKVRSIHVSFAVSHTGLSLPSFYIPYICVSTLYWCFSFWLTSLCIIGSSFIHLISTDSNVFFLMAE